MTPREEILQQALSLSPEDRAYLAAALKESLSEQGDRGKQAADLLAELQRRSAAYQAGETYAVDATEALADLRRRQADETKS